MIDLGGAMIEDSRLSELEVYRKIEDKLQLQERPALGSLVVASNNDELPVHRWFRFKEAYAAELLPSLLRLFWDRPSKALRLADPYCGVGTTLLSAQALADYQVDAIGI